MHHELLFCDALLFFTQKYKTRTLNSIKNDWFEIVRKKTTFFLLFFKKFVYNEYNFNLSMSGNHDVRLNHH
ncbi:hypothetical protein EFP86_09565 [Lentilactobacillus hilgardii]|nr:hypothetical protein [Lentilactobacillus hilgardii]